MKRTSTIVLGAAVAAALFVGLVYAVLMVARVRAGLDDALRPDSPATVGHCGRCGGIGRRGHRWACSGSLRESSRHHIRPPGAIVALATGLIAVLNGGLNLATANGGPGNGNGVIGGAAAFVLGWIAATAGALALARSRRGKLEASR